jgi:hypothetical protein
VIDPQGKSTEYSGYYCAVHGELKTVLALAVNDEPGLWKATVEDLTAGLTAEQAIEVR